MQTSFEIYEVRKRERQVKVKRYVPKDDQAA